MSNANDSERLSTGLATGSPAVLSAEQFYRQLLEQICGDPRRTRARRLAESGLQFWDEMNAEKERATVRQPQENTQGDTDGRSP